MFRRHRKLERAGRNEVLDAQSTGREQIPRELELLLPVNVEDAVHKCEAGFAAVSYTHLDVYKRQAPARNGWRGRAQRAYE